MTEQLTEAATQAPAGQTEPNGAKPAADTSMAFAGSRTGAAGPAQGL